MRDDSAFMTFMFGYMVGLGTVLIIMGISLIIQVIKIILFYKK